MKKKIVSSMLAGAMVMALITGCGGKEDNSKNLIESNESVEVTPTEEAEATPTEEAEATPTEEAEATPTEEAETTPTKEAEVTPTKEAEATPTKEAELTPTVTPQATPTSTETKTEAAISTKEAEQLLLEQYGVEDEGTGNVNSFGYENTVTIDGVQYYNFRWSWLVDDHMSYVTNIAVAVDGSGIYEVTQDENGNPKLVK